MTSAAVEFRGVQGPAGPIERGRAVASPLFEPPGAGATPPQGAGVPPGDKGLSLSHICTQVQGTQRRSSTSLPVSSAITSITYSEGGRSVRMRDKLKAPFAGRGGGGKRGTIQGFSRSSRRHLIELVGRIDTSKIAHVLFVTLTGPPAAMTWEGLNLNLRAWLARVERRWGDRRYFILWRKESHKSGVPHLHALIMWLDKVEKLGEFLHEFRAWNDQAWAGVLKMPEIADTACRVELMKSWNGVTHYTAKYVSKVEDEACLKLSRNTGRTWGIVRRDLMPIQLRLADLSREEYELVMRVMVKLQQRKRRCVQVQDGESREWRTVAYGFDHFPRPWLKWGVDCSLPLRHSRGWPAWLKYLHRDGFDKNGRPRARCGAVAALPGADDVYRFRVHRPKVLRQVQPVVIGWDSCGDRVEFPDGPPRAIPPGLHFMPSKDVLKLLRWAALEVLRRREESQCAPF